MNAAALAAALAAYDPTALAALSSKGLVRRAERDVEAGLVAVGEYSGEGAQVAADGETVRIGVAGPAAAMCTCAARGICRHVLAAVLVLARAGVEDLPDPLAEILALSDGAIAKWAGRAGLRDASALLAAGGEPSIEAGAGSLAVRLSPEQPDVVWVAGRGLAGLITKAPAAKRTALLAAAVLAVRRANGIAAPAAGGAKPTDGGDAVPGGTRIDRTFLDDVSAALFAYFRSGFGAAPSSLERRLENLALSSRADALPRLAALLRALAARVREKRERTATADPAATLALLSEAFALATALRGYAEPGRADPAKFANLRGRVREEFEAAGDLHLIGIGATAWTTAAGARGVTAYFYEPERARWFSATLARGRNQDPAFRPREAYRREAVWGPAPLERLVREELRLTSAAAGGDGRLSFGKDSRAQTLPPQPLADWLRSWPVSFDAWDSLAQHLRAAAAPALTGARPARTVVLLRPQLAADPYPEPFAQRLIWPLADARGRWLALAVPDGAERDGLAAALAKLADRSRVACVAALAVRDGAAFVLQPFAVLRDEAPDSRFESLGLDETSAAGSGTSFFERLAKRARTALRGGPETFVAVESGASPAARAMADASRALVSIAELGGLEVATEHARRLAASGEALRVLGFDALGAAVQRAAAASSGDHAPLLAAAYLLSRAEALALDIPELERSRT